MNLMKILWLSMEIEEYFYLQHMVEIYIQMKSFKMETL